MTLHVCGSQQFPQLFVGDIYGISELIENIGVEVDTILKVTVNKLAVNKVLNHTGSFSKHLFNSLKQMVFTSLGRSVLFTLHK